VRPELVEGLFFPFSEAEEEGQPFDKLRDTDLSANIASGSDA
jgi:hypothetical protein